MVVSETHLHYTDESQKDASAEEQEEERRAKVEEDNLLMEKEVEQWSDAVVEDAVVGEAAVEAAVVEMAAAEDAVVDRRGDGQAAGSQATPRDFAGVVRDGAQSGEIRFRAVPPGVPRLRRPNTVVLHTNRVEGIYYKDVIEAVVKVVGVDAVKTVQAMPHGRTRVTFRASEAKNLFLSQPFTVKGQVIEAQPIESPVVEVKVLYCPDEVANRTVADFLSQFGKVETITREMTVVQGFPSIETGTRIARMSGINSDIPRRSRIGNFPIEIRYKGQIPQCYRCQVMGHVASSCTNEVVCFKCGLSGHTRNQCFKCFNCGKFGHVREKCPELQPIQAAPASTDGDHSAALIDNPATPPAEHVMETNPRDENPNPVTSQSATTSHPPREVLVVQIESHPDRPRDEVCPSQTQASIDGDEMDLDKDPLKRGRDEWTRIEQRKKSRPRS